jgi:hypothetical protein
MSVATWVLAYALFAQLGRYSEPSVSLSGNGVQQSLPIAAPQPSVGSVRGTSPSGLPRTRQPFGEPLSNGAPAAVKNSVTPIQTPPGLSGRNLNQLPLANQPANSIAPLVDRNAPPLGTASAIGGKPTAVMYSILQSPSAAQLPGQKVTLSEVVGTTPSRQEQTECVILYWELSSTVANHYLALREQQVLQACTNRATEGLEVWQAAQDRLNVRLESTRRAAMATQSRLASKLGRPPAAALPLPGDLPHCGNYNPRYDEIFVGRKSTEAEQLKELLPLRYAEIKLAAARVVEMQDLLAATIVDLGPGSGARQAQVVVDAMVLLSLERQAFLQIAEDYNQRIVCYTLLAKPQPLQSSRLVAMLIKQSTNGSATRSPAPSHLRSNAPEGRNGPETFAGGQQWQPQGSSDVRVDTAVVPASGESLQTFRPEKSVLVRPNAL